MTMAELSVLHSPTEDGPAIPTAVKEAIPNILAACARWNIGDNHIVLAHGSRVEGFANASSDVDLWVVSPPGAPPPWLPVFDWISGFHMQPESIAWDSLMSLADRVDAVDPMHHEAVLALSAKDLETYYRVAASVPVICREDPAELRRRFRVSHVARLLSHRDGVRAATELARAVVFARTGDRLEESICLRRAVEHAVDSFLARHGQAFPKRKWRFEKLARVCGRESPIYKTAWRLKAIGADANLRWYRRICREYVSTVAGFYRPQPVVPVGAQRFSQFQLGQGHFVLVDSTSVHALSVDCARLLEMIDGSATLDEIVQRFARRTGLGDRVAARRVYSYFTALRAHGLVDVSPLVD